MGEGQGEVESEGEGESEGAGAGARTRGASDLVRRWLSTRHFGRGGDARGVVVPSSTDGGEGIELVLELEWELETELV